MLYEVGNEESGTLVISVKDSTFEGYIQSKQFNLESVSDFDESFKFRDDI